MPTIVPRILQKGERDSLLEACKTPLFDDQALDELIARTPLADAVDANGDTPLMVAAWHKTARHVQALIPRSDPRALNHMGNTALMEAARSPHHDNVLALLPVSDVTAQNSEGQTALSYAIMWKRRATIDTFLALDVPARPCDIKQLMDRTYAEERLSLPTLIASMSVVQLPLVNAWIEGLSLEAFSPNRLQRLQSWVVDAERQWLERAAVQEVPSVSGAVLSSRARPRL